MYHFFCKKAFNQAKACVFSIHRPATCRRPSATSRVISEPNPFGILVSGLFLTRRPMVRYVFKNNKLSIVQCNLPTSNSDISKPTAPTTTYDMGGDDRLLTASWSQYDGRKLRNFSMSYWAFKLWVFIFWSWIFLNFK